jgi:hypothetical protein
MKIEKRNRGKRETLKIIIHKISWQDRIQTVTSRLPRKAPNHVTHPEPHEWGDRDTDARKSSIMRRRLARWICSLAARLNRAPVTPRSVALKSYGRKVMPCGFDESILVADGRLKSGNKQANGALVPARANLVSDFCHQVVDNRVTLDRGEYGTLPSDGPSSR